MRGLVLRAARAKLRVVFPEGAHETILRACRILLDEDIARPVLVGEEARIRERVARLDLDLGGVTIVEPARSARYHDYSAEYFRMRNRRGVMEATAAARLLDPDYFAAMMLHHGDADVMITGVSAHYAESMRKVLEVIGPAPGFRGISSHHLVLLPKKVLLLADCAVNVEPDAEVLAESALSCARAARVLGLEPRVAMLSFSNFGSVGHARARKVREAVALASQRAPDLVVEGEMQLATALDGALRRRYFPFSRLSEDANVLVAPDLQSGNIALQLIQHLGVAVTIGPVLTGTRLPVHVLQYGATAEDVVHLAALGIVEATEDARTS
jgi:malate dehydrogenase (oxaloacetate-decarboxylating)(NADP+)